MNCNRFSFLKCAAIDTSITSGYMNVVINKITLENLTIRERPIANF